MGARRTTIIPKAPTARILMNAGAKRVSDEAAKEFVHVLTEIAEKIAEQSVQIAKHTGRKTVQEEDVRLAAR